MLGPAMSETLQVRIEAEGDGYSVGSLGRVILQVWESRTSLDGAEAATRALLHLARDGEPVGLFIVVRPGVKPPEKAVRTELTNLGFHEAVGACAFVTDGNNGFWAATMRGVLASMVFVARPRFPVKTFSDLGKAAAWMAETLPQGGLSGAALEGAVAVARPSNRRRFAAGTDPKPEPEPT